MVGFGLKAMHKYAFVYNDRAQIKRYLSMMFFQVIVFTVLPLFVIRSGGAWGLAYVWPLSVRANNWQDWVHTKQFYLAILSSVISSSSRGLSLRWVCT